MGRTEAISSRRRTILSATDLSIKASIMSSSAVAKKGEQDVAAPSQGQGMMESKEYSAKAEGSVSKVPMTGHFQTRIWSMSTVRCQLFDASLIQDTGWSQSQSRRRGLWAVLEQVEEDDKRRREFGGGEGGAGGRQRFVGHSSHPVSSLSFARLIMVMDVGNAAGNLQADAAAAAEEKGRQQRAMIQEQSG